MNCDSALMNSASNALHQESMVGDRAFHAFGFPMFLMSKLLFLNLERLST